MLHTDNGGQENHFPEHKDVKLLWVCGYDTTFASYPEIDNLPAVPFSYPYDKLTHAVLESNWTGDCNCNFELSSEGGR